MPVENPLFFRPAPKMASMRESDTGLWLHNKLGSTDELWAPPSIASLLTASVIDNIRLCFHGLSSAVKLKLLLGMLHLPRRAVDEVSAGCRSLRGKLNRSGVRVCVRGGEVCRRWREGRRKAGGEGEQRQHHLPRPPFSFHMEKRGTPCGRSGLAAALRWREARRRLLLHGRCPPVLGGVCTARLVPAGIPASPLRPFGEGAVGGRGWQSGALRPSSEGSAFAVRKKCSDSP